MLALISPAKRLDLSPWTSAHAPTQPALLEEIRLLAKRCRALTPPDLIGLMSISDNLAELNFTRFQEFSLPFTSKNAKPAALAFAGDTYLGFQAETLEAEAWEFAQDHVGILSGLYGLLRPLDLIQPYRLEMGTRLDNSRGKDLYAFWTDRVTALVNERTQGHADRRVINLASREYIKVVDPRRLEGSGLTMSFKEVRGGKPKVIALMAKRARGSMARWIARERIEQSEDLKAFSEDGYAYRRDLSTDLEWVFTRTTG